MVIFASTSHPRVSRAQHPKGVIAVDWSWSSAVKVGQLAITLGQWIMYGLLLALVVFLPSFDIIIGGVGLTSSYNGWIGWIGSAMSTGIQTGIWFMITEGRSAEKGELVQRIGFVVLALVAVIDTWIDALSIILAGGGIPDESVTPENQQIFWLGFALFLLFALAGEVILAMITTSLRRWIIRRKANSSNSTSEAELASMGAVPSDAFPPADEPGMWRR